MESVPERQPELAGEDWRALASRVWSRACGDWGYVGEVVLTRVAFPEHDTTIPCQMAKSNAPRTFFPIFSAARQDGGRTAFGLGRSGQRKAPTSADFCEDADSGGRTAPRLQAVDYSAVCPQASCAVEVWRTHNIHHATRMSSEHECESRRSESRIGRHHVLADGLSASVPGGFSGHMTALRSLLLYNIYSALSSFARH